MAAAAARPGHDWRVELMLAAPRKEGVIPTVQLRELLLGGQKAVPSTIGLQTLLFPALGNSLAQSLA